jgi:hypothetical protein
VSPGTKFGTFLCFAFWFLQHLLGWFLIIEASSSEAPLKSVMLLFA